MGFSSYLGGKKEVKKRDCCPNQVVPPFLRFFLNPRVYITISYLGRFLGAFKRQIELAFSLFVTFFGFFEGSDTSPDNPKRLG